MVMFHSYVSLPEGNKKKNDDFSVISAYFVAFNKCLESETLQDLNLGSGSCMGNDHTNL